MLRNLKELYQYRALLWALTQRELKARYRGSMLGFLWTFLNPLLLMGVYALIFGTIMKQSMPHYTYFMFIGLLPWIWFSTTLGTGASTISERRDLLTKVYFPAQVLPSTVVVTNLINYLLTLPLMVGLGALSGVYPSWQIIAFPFLVFAQLLFTVALLFIVSALNVTFRDLQHIVNNILTLVFFASPILFPASLILNAPLPHWMKVLLIYGNPISILSMGYQSIFYSHELPAMGPLLGVIAISIALFWIAAHIFEGRREEFAELI